MWTHEDQPERRFGQGRGQELPCLETSISRIVKGIARSGESMLQCSPVREGGSRTSINRVWMFTSSLLGTVRCWVFPGASPGRGTEKKSQSKGEGSMRKLVSLCILGVFAAGGLLNAQDPPEKVRTLCDKADPK